MDTPAQALELIDSFINNRTIGRSMSDKPEYTPMLQEQSSLIKMVPGSSKGLLTASIVMNIVLAIALLSGLAYYLWRRSQRDDYGHNRVFYTPLSSA